MRELTGTEFKIFVDAVRDYFEPVGGNLEVRTAYLSEQAQNTLHPYIGLIRISGAFHGQVYLSAPAGLLRQLLRAYEEPCTDEASLLDVAGEVANTLAGSVRRHLGSELEISVPEVIGPGGQPPANIRNRAYTIALSWRGFEGIVVVDLVVS